MKWVLILALVLTACGDDTTNVKEPADDAGGGTDMTAPTNDAGTEDDTGTEADADMPAFEQGWTAVSPLALGARQETSVVHLDGKIYVLGGFNAGIQIVPTVEIWDPQTNEWSRAADLPVPMHHANAAAIDGKIFVLGFLAGGFQADGRGFVYDPADDAWSPIAAMPAGRIRGASAVGAIDGKIYVVGGLRGGALAEVDVYDPEADSWMPLGDAPRVFDHAGFGVIGDELIIAGGRNQSIGAHTNDVDIYDPADDSWRSGAPMPTSRGGVAAAVFEGDLFVFGGEGNTEENSGVFAQVEAYDPIADEWSEQPPMDDPRHGMGAAGFDGGILIPGGARTQAFGAVDASDVYVP